MDGIMLHFIPRKMNFEDCNCEVEQIFNTNVYVLYSYILIILSPYGQVSSYNYWGYTVEPHKSCCDLDKILEDTIFENNLEIRAFEDFWLNMNV